MAVILLVFGPKRMPEIARQLGKMFGQFRRTSESMRKEFYNSIYPPDEENQSLGHDRMKQDLRSVKQEIEMVTKDIKQASKKALEQTVTGRTGVTSDSPKVKSEREKGCCDE